MGAPAGEGQDEEDEKEAAEQDAGGPSRETQRQRGEDCHGGDAEQRPVRWKARKGEERGANWLAGGGESIARHSMESQEIQGAG